ncbi:hypothetical protein H8356DRAFT_1433507 [Neocallimastix lanati (nom. inval.)]|nr:hypothetical protein H8356DRAFT_1433507 [Neocallimastix sp. JGI-2020a]
MRQIYGLGYTVLSSKRNYIFRKVVPERFSRQFYLYKKGSVGPENMMIHIIKFEAAKSIVKNKIKDEISNSSILFNVNIKRKYDEISQGMVTRSRRKQLPPDIAFDEILNESKYYKTKRDKNL